MPKDPPTETTIQNLEVVDFFLVDVYPTAEQHGCDTAYKKGFLKASHKGPEYEHGVEKKISRAMSLWVNLKARISKEKNNYLLQKKSRSIVLRRCLTTP